MAKTDTKALREVKPLPEGETGTFDHPERQEVPDWVIEATLPFLPPVVAALVQVQRLTGMRPSEVLSMRVGNIDQSRDNGRILDGRNRAKACQELGIEPKYVEYEGNDPVGFVLSKNLHRRQLTQSQLAMLINTLANLPKGRPDLNAQAMTQDEIAKRLGVSERLLQFAQAVRSKAIPEVVALAEAGKLSVDKAAALAKATPEEQLEAVAAIGRGEKCPTFKTQDSQGKATKEPTLDVQLSDQLKAALGHPKDSPERSGALVELFKTLNDVAFAKKTPREEFLQCIVAECAEYGVLPSGNEA